MTNNDKPPETLSAARVFGQRIRDRRIAANLTQETLAEQMSAAGVPMRQTSVAKTESAIRPTSVPEICAFAAVLGCDAADLVGGLAEPPALRELAQAEYDAATLAAEKEEMEIRLADLQRQVKEADANVARLRNHIDKG